MLKISKKLVQNKQKVQPKQVIGFLYISPFKKLLFKTWIVKGEKYNVKLDLQKNRKSKIDVKVWQNKKGWMHMDLFEMPTKIDFVFTADVDSFLNLGGGGWQ